METQEEMALIARKKGLEFPDEDTVPTLFWNRVQNWSDQIAMREKVYGIWRDITWKEYGENAKYVGLGLISLGLEKGDTAAIINENNPEWLYCDMGIIGAGGVTVGIYTTDSASQVQYIVDHCGAKFYIAQDEEQLDKILEVRQDCPKLEKIFVLDLKGLRDFQDPMVMSYAELVEKGREVDRTEPDLFENRLREVKPEDLAILVYTSGTTGPPKGAMLSNDNILKMSKANHLNLPAYPEDVMLSYLPLCHVAQRAGSVFVHLLAGQTLNFVEDMDTVAENMREVSPTTAFGVPRIWEKYYSTIQIQMEDSTSLEKLMFNWAVSVGYKVADYKLNHRPVPVHLGALFKILDWVALKNIKKIMGLNRARYLASGAAPISADLLRWYNAIGLNVIEGYGQTESSALGTLHRVDDVRFGTVGVPTFGTEIKITEEGEILIKGPGVFMGYYKDPEKTAETIIDGWLYTGDVGFIDDDVHLHITDRMKDIIITSGGKNITPSEIENQLKFSPYITDAVVIGDGRKYLTALIMIDDENVMKFAQDNRIPFTTYKSLTKDPDIHKLIDKEVRKVNKEFARVETIKKFSLIDIQLTTDDDEITPTMKLKRKFVNEKFSNLIESMY